MTYEGQATPHRDHFSGFNFGWIHTLFLSLPGLHFAWKTLFFRLQVLDKGQCQSKRSEIVLQGNLLQATQIDHRAFPQVGYQASNSVMLELWQVIFVLSKKFVGHLADLSQ